MLMDCRYLITGIPDGKTADMLYELFANHIRVAIWSHRGGRAFILTRMIATLLPGRSEPGFDLTFQQVGPLDGTERLLDDRADWIISAVAD